MQLGYVFQQLSKELLSSPILKSDVFYTQTQAQLDARILIEFITGLTQEKIIAFPETPISEDDYKKLENLISQRKQGKAIAYIIGYKEFYGRNFFVTPNVLIPRPESELLVDCALQIIQQHNTDKKCTILDCGTGSGCIGITLAAELNSDTKNNTWNVILSDISKKCIDIAQKNAQTILGHTLPCYTSNLLCNAQLQKQQYNIVIANLPYLTPQEYLITQTKKQLLHEPQLALEGSFNFNDHKLRPGNDQGMAHIQKLLLQTAHWQHKHTILLEADPLQTDAITRTSALYGYTTCTIHRDIRTYPRVFEISKN